MKTKHYRATAIVLALCLIASCLSLAGCSHNKAGNTTPTPNSTLTTTGTNTSDHQISIADLRKQYAQEDAYNYTQPIYNVSPKEYIHKIPLGFSAKDYSEEQLKELFQVYTDSKLENTADPVVEYDDATQTISLKPSKWGILPVVDVPGFSEKEYSTWGNISKLYFTVTVDTKTGEKLEKPQVTVVTFTNGLQSPTASFEVLEDGRPGIKWDPVEGASSYMVCYTLYYDAFTHNDDGSISIQEYGIDQVTTTQCILKLAETKDTFYHDIYKKETGDSVSFMNYLAATDADLQKGFCVIALDANGHSLSSNILKIKTLLPKLPCTCTSAFMESYDDMSQVPFTSSVSMVSGDITVQYLRIIDFTAAIEEAKKQAATETSYCYVTVPFTVQGTSFTGSFTIDGSSTDIVSKVEQLKDRYEKEAPNSAVNTPDINLPDTPPSDVTTSTTPIVEPSVEPTPTETPATAPPVSEAPVTETPTNNANQSTIDMPDIPITASNSLSAYLASQMLLGKTSISLNEFTEATNTDYLTDCIHEAVTQNPLILNAQSFSFDYATNSLVIKYQDIDAATMKAKQTQIKEEVGKVVKQIITDSMSDLEKEEAINKYLCDSAEYDTAACEHALANNMTIVDPQYLDAFTPYGILIKKKGVCASYAASFKLLADACGLDAIVVTGNLNGTVPHAWNRIKIENQWYSVDSTNNDNETIPNALFNLSDEEAASVLVEDTDYICDSKLGTYKASDSKYEFYRANNKYFEDSDITGIANAIKEGDGNKLFRTNCSLTTENAKTIIEQALTQNNYSGAYRYQVFLGVVVLVLGN